MTVSSSVPAVLDAAAASALLRREPTTRLLDVRSPGEFAAVHIPGAYNVPLDTLGEHAAEIRRGLAAPIVLVCQSGGRARRAEEALRAAGMRTLHILDGGIQGWIAAGEPVVRARGPISLERQVRIAAGGLAATGAILALTVHVAFALLPAAIGSGLVVAGITDWCGLGLLLARLPYNRRAAACDPVAMVRALVQGTP